MKGLGLLARVDHRGLATLTTNVWRNLQPERTLVVDMGEHSPYVCQPWLYPDRWGVVTYDELRTGHYDWGPFLEGLACVYTAELPYDDRLFIHANRRGIRTVLHVMPELDPYVRSPHLPRPDVIALPTTWMAERYSDAVVLPVPIEPRHGEFGASVLHPAGHPAMRDRNGTRIVLEASDLVDARWLVRAQQPPDQPWHSARVEVGDVPRTGDVYRDAGVVVLPRRYGGLSLTLHEAVAAGLPVIATDTEPYGPLLHPAGRLPVRATSHFEAKGGRITMRSTTAADLAEAVRAVVSDEGLRATLAAHSRAWAQETSWDRLRPAWERALGG